MRVIYRSASKLRLNSNVYSYIIEASKKAAALFVDKVGEGTITRFLFSAVAWLIFASCLPLEIFVVLLAWTHAIVLVPFVQWLEPDAEDINVIDLGSFGKASSVEEINNQLVTLVVTAEGSPPNIHLLQDHVRDILNSKPTSSKLEQNLKHRLGCKIWKRDVQFDVKNHVKIASNQWRGVTLTEETIRYWVDDFCNGLLPCNHPPWDLTVVPYQDNSISSSISNYRTESHAYVIRIHRDLTTHFKLSDIITDCGPANLELKKAVASVLSGAQDIEDVEQVRDIKSSIKHHWDIIKQHVKLAWMAPWVLYTELLCSCRYYMPRNFIEDTKRTRVLFWSEEFPQTLVQKIQKESGVSKGVILTSCLTGALKQYYRITGQKTPDDLLAFLPTYDQDTFHLDESLPSSLGTLAMPMGISCPVHRLKVIRKRLSPSIRRELSKVGINYGKVVLPPILVRLATELISRKYLAAINNVYVSDMSGKIFGNKVTNVFYWRPLLNCTGISLSIMNYHDKITLAVMGKRESLRRPDILVSSFQRELYDLALALNIKMERKPTPPPSPKLNLNNKIN